MADGRASQASLLLLAGGPDVAVTQSLLLSVSGGADVAASQAQLLTLAPIPAIMNRSTQNILLALASDPGDGIRETQAVVQVLARHVDCLTRWAQCWKITTVRPRFVAYDPEDVGSDEVYFESFVWNKPSGITALDVYVSGGGGGGGSGCNGYSGQDRRGGAGGGGGGYSEASLDPDDIDDTVTVTVGAGGVGGLPVSDPGAPPAAVNGNPGTAGGTSSFGSYVTATGGSGGAGGVFNLGTGPEGTLGGAGGVGSTGNGGDGGYVSGLVTGGAHPGDNAPRAAGGGAGGGIINPSGAYPGALGGDGDINGDNNAGGSPGDPGIAGSPGTDTPTYTGGAGGAGGGGAGSRGGAGGIGGGGAGGGGAQTSTSGFGSGAGGVGGSGYVRIAYTLPAGGGVEVELEPDQVFRFTSHDQPVTLLGEVYEPCDSLSASAAEQAMVAGSAGDVELSGIIADDAISEADLYAGIFDQALVEVWMVPWDATAGEPFRLTAGVCGDLSQGDEGFRIDVQTPAGRLQQQSLLDVYTPGCRWSLGDTRCGVDLGALEVAGTVTAVASQHAATRAQYRQFADSSRAEAAGWFDLGTLEWTSGANAGHIAEIRQFTAGGGFVLWRPMPHPLQVGDEYSAWPGCDKTPDTCKNKFSNYRRYGAYPDLPGNDAILQTPNAKP